MHGRPLLGALVLAATIAFVVGVAIERGSGEAHATQRAESHGSGHIEAAAETRAEGGEAHTGADHGRSELRPLQLARPLSARRGPRPT